MHENETPDVDRDLLEQLGYERSDVPVDRRLGYAAVGFFGFFTVCIFIAWAFIGLVDRTQSFRPQDEQMPERRMMPSTGMPLLQSDRTAAKDIADLRADEEAALAKTEWADPAHTMARIPIDKAEDIVLKRGLPTRADAKLPEDAQ